MLSERWKRIFVFPLFTSYHSHQNGVQKWCMTEEYLHSPTSILLFHTKMVCVGIGSIFDGLITKVYLTSSILKRGIGIYLVNKNHPSVSLNKGSYTCHASRCSNWCIKCESTNLPPILNFHVILCKKKKKVNISLYFIEINQRKKNETFFQATFFYLAYLLILMSSNPIRLVP